MLDVNNLIRAGILVKYPLLNGVFLRHSTNLLLTHEKGTAISSLKKVLTYMALAHAKHGRTHHLRTAAKLGLLAALRQSGKFSTVKIRH